MSNQEASDGSFKWSSGNALIGMSLDGRTKVASFGLPSEPIEGKFNLTPSEEGRLPFGFARGKKFRPYTHLRNARETNFMGSLFVYRVAASCELRRKRGERRDANEAERVCGSGVVRRSGGGRGSWGD